MRREKSMSNKETFRVAWKSNPFSGSSRRIAYARLKFLSTLRQIGWAETLRRGEYKLRQGLGLDFSAPYQMWLRENGRSRLAETLRHGMRRVRGRLGWRSSDPYQEWLTENRPRFVELERQRRWTKRSAGLPHIVVLVTTAGATERDIEQTRRSLRQQTYHLWSPMYVESLSLAGLPQQAVDGRGYAYVGVMKAGDTLSPDAFYQFARTVQDEPDHPPDVIYCDEDHIDGEVQVRSRPILKPSWSPETILGYDYMGRLTLVRSELMEQADGFDPEMGEAAEWDLKLRITCLTDRILRLPKCLYHNRSENDARQARCCGEYGRAA